MPTSDHNLAARFQDTYPHTFNALQHLVMAMADYQKARHKLTWFGKDRSLAAYRKFEEKLRDTLLAMVIDNAVPRSASAAQFRMNLGNAIAAFSDAFPNWQDAYSFAMEYLVENQAEAERRIADMLR